jgi:hypothetical protein
MHAAYANRLPCKSPKQLVRSLRSRDIWKSIKSFFVEEAHSKAMKNDEPTIDIQSPARAMVSRAADK